MLAIVPIKFGVNEGEKCTIDKGMEDSYMTEYDNEEITVDPDEEEYLASY